MQMRIEEEGEIVSIKYQKPLHSLNFTNNKSTPLGTINTYKTSSLKNLHGGLSDQLLKNKQKIKKHTKIKDIVNSNDRIFELCVHSLSDVQNTSLLNNNNNNELSKQCNMESSKTDCELNEHNCVLGPPLNFPHKLKVSHSLASVLQRKYAKDLFQKAMSNEEKLQLAFAQRPISTEGHQFIKSDIDLKHKQMGKSKSCLRNKLDKFNMDEWNKCKSRDPIDSGVSLATNISHILFTKDVNLQTVEEINLEETQSQPPPPTLYNKGNHQHQYRNSCRFLKLSDIKPINKVIQHKITNSVDVATYARRGLLTSSPTSDYLIPNNPCQSPMTSTSGQCSTYNSRIYQGNKVKLETSKNILFPFAEASSNSTLGAKIGAGSSHLQISYKHTPEILNVSNQQQFRTNKYTTKKNHSERISLPKIVDMAKNASKIRSHNSSSKFSAFNGLLISQAPKSDILRGTNENSITLNKHNKPKKESRIERLDFSILNKLQNKDLFGEAKYNNYTTRLPPKDLPKIIDLETINSPRAQTIQEVPTEAVEINSNIEQIKESAEEEEDPNIHLKLRNYTMQKKYIYASKRSAVLKNIAQSKMFPNIGEKDSIGSIKEEKLRENLSNNLIVISNRGEFMNYGDNHHKLSEVPSIRNLDVQGSAHPLTKPIMTKTGKNDQQVTKTTKNTKDIQNTQNIPKGDAEEPRESPLNKRILRQSKHLSEGMRRGDKKQNKKIVTEEEKDTRQRENLFDKGICSWEGGNDADEHLQILFASEGLKYQYYYILLRTDCAKIIAQLGQFGSKNRRNEISILNNQRGNHRTRDQETNQIRNIEQKFVINGSSKSFLEQDYL